MVHPLLCDGLGWINEEDSVTAESVVPHAGTERALQRGGGLNDGRGRRGRGGGIEGGQAARRC